MIHLSEDKIKQAAIRFLKTYYKFRPRTSKTETRLDMQSTTGIIADGMVSFEDENERPFVATVEATSHETRGEVIYTTQRKMLFWDSLAFGSIAAAFLFSYGYAYNHFTVQQIGLIGSLALMLSFMTACTGLYYLVFRYRHKYRYIYAIEQFKQYHANEQWIAIAEDVLHPFEAAYQDEERKSKDYKYFEELKAQCIINGIGLIEVDQQLNARPLITPARQDVFDTQRGVTQFFQGKLPHSKAAVRLQSMWQKTGIDAALQSNTAQSLLRYQQSYFHQIIIVGLAAVILGIIYYKELQNNEIAYVDEKQYLQQMDDLKANPSYEPAIVVIDTPSKVVTHEEDLDKFLADDIDEDLLRPDDVTEAEAALLGVETAYDERMQLLIQSDDDYTAAYDCERFYNIRQKVYVIQAHQFVSVEAAQQRLKRLQAKDFPANILWLGCFSKDKDYIIYLDLMYTSREEAQSSLADYKRRLLAHKLRATDLQIRSISRVH